MAEKRRDFIKTIRDGAKSGYEKGSECEICGSTENLDFHHFHGLTNLFDRWVSKNKLKIETTEDVLAIRDEFIQEHHDELYVKAVTLCHDHHMKLHSIYGKSPELVTAAKQERWVARQREKHELV